MNGFFVLGIICGCATLILFITGIVSEFTDAFGCGALLISISVVLFWGTIIFLAIGCKDNSVSEPCTNQNTQYSQVQEETKPKINENYNYNYNHNYNYNEGETTATYNVQTTTEPCTCSNCLKERTTVATTTEPNTKCTCSNCR